MEGCGVCSYLNAREVCVCVCVCVSSYLIGMAYVYVCVCVCVCLCVCVFVLVPASPFEAGGSPNIRLHLDPPHPLPYHSYAEHFDCFTHSR